MMPCTLNKRPNRITVLNESTKQILSNFTPINFYFTEFELVHYSLIDWLSYACQASFRLVDSTASKKRIVHLDSEIELFQFHVVLCRGLRCNVMHIWTSYIAGDLKGMKVYICKQSDSVPNLASFYRTCRGLQLCFAVFLFYHQWNTGIFLKNE